MKTPFKLEKPVGSSAKPTGKGSSPVTRVGPRRPETGTTHTPPPGRQPAHAAPSPLPAPRHTAKRPRGAPRSAPPSHPVRPPFRGAPPHPSAAARRTAVLRAASRPDLPSGEGGREGREHGRKRRGRGEGRHGSPGPAQPRDAQRAVPRQRALTYGPPGGWHELSAPLRIRKIEQNKILFLQNKAPRIPSTCSARGAVSPRCGSAKARPVAATSGSRRLYLTRRSHRRRHHIAKNTSSSFFPSLSLFRGVRAAG